MPQAVSPAYLKQLCEAREYAGLSWLSAVLCGSESFAPAEPGYGLPVPLFLLVESLFWFAQAARSGSWTYFEATPPQRQAALIRAFQAEGFPTEFAERYAFGARNWRHAGRLAALDTWLDRQEELHDRLLWELVERNRSLVVQSATF